MNDVLSKKKAAADSSLRFDEYYKALSQYVSALGSPELEAIGAALRQDALQSLSNGAVVLAVAQDAVSRLLGARQAIDAAESSGVDEIYQRGVESVGGVAAQLIAPALDAVLQLEPLESPDALGGICSNLALTVTNLRLWPQVLVSSLAACMFSSSLRAKNVARYVVAARHLGVEMEPPAKFTDDSLRSLLARIDAERQGRFDFTLLAKGGANTPIAEYRAEFAIQTSEGRGHGLFATAPIAAGQTIICEHAVGYSNLGEDVTGLAALQRLKLSTALNCTGFEMRRVAHLYDGTARSEMVNAADYSDLLGVPAYTPLRFFTPEVVPQSVDHLAGALKFNAYTGEHYVEQLPNDWLSIGLFPTLALVNHDVVPNVTRQCYGRFLVVRATRPIAAGEEIVGTYVTALAYLVEDNPLDRWVPDVPMKRPPEVLKLRALDDKLGATLEKLTAFTEATSAGLLERVELPARRAFTCNAGLFAAMTKADQHPALIALLDLLASEAPDLSVLEQCAKITHKYERKMNKAMVQKIRSLLEPWCMICLGHANVIAAGSRNV